MTCLPPPTYSAPSMLSYLHVWRGSFTCVWFTCVTWLIHTCDLPHLHVVGNDSFIRVTWPIHTLHSIFLHRCIQFVVSFIIHKIFTHPPLPSTSSEETPHTMPIVSLWIHIFDMGWLRLVGSLKLQVSFAKEPYERGHILQKSCIILFLSFMDLYS